MELKYSDHVKLLLRASGISEEEIELNEARAAEATKLLLQDSPDGGEPISEDLRKKFESSRLTPISTFAHPSKLE